MKIRIVGNENGKVSVKVRNEKDLRKMTCATLAPTSQYAGLYFTEEDKGKEFEVEAKFLSKGQHKGQLFISYVIRKNLNPFNLERG